MKFGELKNWQKKRLLFSFLTYVIVIVVFLAYASVTMYTDKKAEDDYWVSMLQTPKAVEEKASQIDQNATRVQVGTYVENLKEVNLKTSSFRMVVLIWFKWEGNDNLDMAKHFRVYKGTINKTETVKNYHENGENYQAVRCDVSITKNYWNRRFPLESHQLRMYVESELPVDEVVFVNDSENSGVNASLGISGYDLRRNETGTTMNEYDNNHSDPEISGDIITAEHITALELNRDSMGLYVKCFIALVGTITWVLITLFICTYHRVDPLSMIPAALFGTVTNIMVGANLLPDALQLGLLEFVNIFGILTILAVAMTIININRIRNKYEDRDFASFYGRIMFYTIVVLVVAGNIILPISAYMF